MTFAAQAVTPLFDPTRLRLAREAEGLKKSELAQQLEITPAAISQFESGVTKPSAATLGRIAMLLDFPPEFFARSDDLEDPLDISTTFFRSLRSTRQVDRQRAVAYAALVWIVVRSLEQKVRLPKLQHPHLTIAPDASQDEIEEAAAEVRRQWGLEKGPIPHVVRLLEANGIVVTRFQTGTEKIDAFSRPFPVRPIVVLGDDKGDLARSRLDAAHELGHLVMHPDPEAGNPIMERQAFAFASAFLMPRDEIIEFLPHQRVNWQQMMKLKQSWGVSIAALLYRARTLNTLDRTRYETAMKMMSRKGWRKEEPGYLGNPERPALLQAAVTKLTEAGFTQDDLLRLTRLSARRLTSIVGAETAGDLVIDRDELLRI